MDPESGKVPDPQSPETVPLKSDKDSVLPSYTDATGDTTQQQQKGLLKEPFGMLSLLQTWL